MTYSEMLRDPRWQKLRLKVMERDNWTCQRCKRDDKTLEIEHFFYFGLPWEIDMIWLITVCCDCHEYLESVKYRRVDITDEYSEILYVVHLKLTGQSPFNQPI